MDQELSLEDKLTISPSLLEFLPLTATSQYLLFWYAAETVPGEIEQSVAGDREIGSSGLYRSPQAFPASLRLKERIAQDHAPSQDKSSTLYEPFHHSNTGVDEEERLYESYLLPVAQARQKLRGSVMEDVVRRAHEAIELRMQMEGKV